MGYNIRLYLYAMPTIFLLALLISIGLSDRYTTQAQHRSIGSSAAIATSERPGYPVHAGCLSAPRCTGTPLPATVSQLVSQANRYDRRLVRVTGLPIMVKPRRSYCGNYHYFVLKDREGYHIAVTDYTDSSLALQRRDGITVIGYYRAELHQLDVCATSR